MNTAQVRVLEQVHDVSLTCLLQCTQRSSCEPKVALVVLRDLTDLKLTVTLNFQTQNRCKNPKKILTNRWNGAILIKSSVDFWNLRISRSATVPGRQRRFFSLTLSSLLLLVLLLAKLTRFVFVSRMRSMRRGSEFLRPWGAVDFRAVCFVISAFFHCLLVWKIK